MSDTPKKNTLTKLAICFLAGILTTNIYFLLKDAALFFFVGSPVVCQSSFPRTHTACIYSRFGIGEQAVTFTIDDETVFFTSDFAGGDLAERITWDKAARYVTFHVIGLGEKTYNAETKAQK